ncbi:MAG: Rpn family recombination-promoting nuclease/putative transposase, partial [Methanocorpusculum sp.]|nr:Rpn family recombination-promoting nuclease/putative transposase [Methanocorpusculum sp.]
MPQGLDPKVDVVFKSIFGTEENKSILISLLNAVLGWTGEQQIVAAKILNPYLEPEYIDDSYGILDIKVQLGTGELVDVEMQMGDRANMERRSTYYICRIFGDQKITRSRYQDLNRAIAINILDFVRIKDSRRYHTCYRMREVKEDFDLTDAIEMHFIELPKLTRERADYKNPLDRWAMFLKGWDDMELLERLTEEDPAIAQAKKVLEKMGSDPRAKEIYEQRLKAIMDRNSELYEAVLKGKREGKAEGRAEGKQEGKREGRLETARAALQKGLGAELVVEITGL